MKVRKLPASYAFENVKGLYILTVIVGIVWMATDAKLWFFL